MDYPTLALLLALAGFMLIVAELFVPSGGMISVLCVVAFICSIWCAYKGWWAQSPGYFWSYIGGLLTIIPLFVGGAFRVLETTSIGDRVLLRAPSLQDVTPYQEEQQRLEALIGQHGVAHTLLNPGGLIRVGAEKLHAFSEGMMIDPETAVEVVEVRGTRVLVRPARERPPEAAPPTDGGDDALAASEPLPGAAPLDFDVPPG